MKFIQKIKNSQRLKYFLYEGQAGKLFQPAYSIFVYGKMNLIQATHRIQIGKQSHQQLDDNVTVVIKTFLRPNIARRCVKSLRQVFGGKIIVVDDSPTPINFNDPKVEVLPLPFNSGLSIGRNAGVKASQTPYTLITDDDAVFTCASDLSKAYSFLEAHPEVDGIALTLIKLPRMNAGDIYAEWLYPGALPLIKPVGEPIDGYPVVAVPVNLFLARTDSLRHIPWDERLKIFEHRDYFSAAAGKLLFVQSDIPAYHVRTPWNKKYMKFRNETQPYMEYCSQKWHLIKSGEIKPQGHQNTPPAK